MKVLSSFSFFINLHTVFLPIINKSEITMFLNK